MNDGSVRNWRRQLKKGRADVHNEGGQWRESIVTEDVVHQVDQFVRENGRFTIADHSKRLPKFLVVLYTELFTQD